MQDSAALIARLDVDRVDWLGTSMGGLIGMMLAAQPGSPIRKPVLNDIGPFISKVGLARIASYVGLDPMFPSLDALEAALRANFASFGQLSDVQFRKMARDSAREKPEGGWGFDYDSRIGDAFNQGPIDDIDLWSLWEAIRRPTLSSPRRSFRSPAARGRRGDTRRGPKASLVEFAGVGHAPALLSEDQISAVRGVLLE